ncbi:MAG: hypothetical protein DWQ34_00895 [Planctomycetota bacterium]|nr:MAG: hypothetical protein DWQ34_03620 [Planctomycetota bacterium]REJ97927.1 MAG: hypothetical protein DWQ34_00895 [Planctomycetota bacterium]REK21952.1 MAG: hypothetical protein DWQ41_20385 [Planctomycetota bacterium]REK25602.1 MAG: hypothetical protein DWQ41_11755 [Planctomycetota bacterium]REK31687.1 MAG: hypothetical protein DWQ45_18930 [Planctomycetota bacterium]
MSRRFHDTPKSISRRSGLAALCQQAALGHEPRRVLEELSQIRSIDVILPTKSGVEIRKRCVTKPTDHQAILLHHLGLTLPSSLQQTET